MLDKKTLVERLKSYEFSKDPPDIKDRDALGRESRAHGFGNMLRNNLEQATMTTIERDYDQVLIDIMLTGYGFLRVCYDLIDFNELEDHREETAVNILFKTRDLLPKLGRALYTFTTECARTKYTGKKITDKTPGYQELITLTREIRRLDEDEQGLPGVYKKRVLQLEAELAQP